MTKLEMAILGKDFSDNYYTKYHHEVITSYKYRGEMKTRKTRELTEEGKRIGSILRGEKIFRCPECGEMVAYTSLEYWLVETAEGIAADKCPCSECYESEMGEDL